MQPLVLREVIFADPDSIYSVFPSSFRGHAVEVDGSQHVENTTDIIRDAHFRASRFRIIRLRNDEALRNLDAASLTIFAEMKNSGVDSVASP